MRLLLINPRFPESFWSFRWAVQEVLPGKRALNPPLGLATLAALCPPHWQVQIVDENVESLPLAPEVDIVGVCGMGVQFQRQRELLAYFRGQGYRVIAGGSYASLCPEKYADVADTVVAGESEYVWKRFCEDVERRAALTLYRETGEVAITDSPTPRFDLLQLQRYSTATMQFSRGCPYRCEFCDIIVMFGRRPRVKSLEQIERELDALRAQGVRQIFFVDDNLIGNRPQAKHLLGFLREYQERHRYWFSLGTEASINLAQDPELLALFREANFGWVFIGIETPDPESLKETRKTQNLQEDLLTSVQRIHAHGIDVLAGFIVGFDNDTLATFDLQYRFITQAGIQIAMIGLLHALPRTPLYERLLREGRLREPQMSADNTRAATNVVPKNMRYEEMVEGYVALYRCLLADREIARRIRNKLRHLKRPVYQSGYSWSERIGIFLRLLFKGILPGGPVRLYYFLRTFPILAPSRAALVVSEWIGALSMRKYAQQYLYAEPSRREALERRVATLREALSSYVSAGHVTLAWRTTGGPNLALTLRGLLDRRFFRRAAVQLDRLLRQTRTRLTLRIAGLPQPQLEPLQRLLARLARHGDRVSIVIDEKLRALIPIDSSVFHLVLAAKTQ